MLAIQLCFFQEFTQIREQILQPRTIRNAFADRGILPYDPDKVIKPLVDSQTPEPKLRWFDGPQSPPLQQQASSIPSSPPKSSAEARRTRDKIHDVLQQYSISADLRRQLQRVARPQIRLAEDLSLLNDTLENRLPKNLQLHAGHKSN